MFAHAEKIIKNESFGKQIRVILTQMLFPNEKVLKENEYVAASEVLGASRIRILMKEVIPNSISSVLIMATTDIGNQILMFSTLSFLGLGSAPPTPEWGMMVSDGADYFNKFWVAGFPGLAIFTMAVGANFIGDGLRDLLDPKLRKQF